jgi:allophanate hydrolase subunit 2
MSAALTIIAAGPGVTLQDAGRHGYLRYGVTAAGPMDRLAMATANLAVGAPEGATAIEVSLGGIELTADGATLPVAVAGGNFDIALEGQRLPSAVRLALVPGVRLRIRAGTDGAWCYVAVGGRIDVAPMLGSNATHTRSSLGGIDGRAVAAGDVLPVRDMRPCESGAATLTAPWLARRSRRSAASPGRSPTAATAWHISSMVRRSRRPTGSMSSPMASSWARSRCLATAGRRC